MNSKIAIVVLVQLMLCIPLIRPAVALDRDQDPEQLWNINWELTQGSLNHRDPLRVKDNRQALLRDQGRLLSQLRQNDLLQELLTPGVIRHESNQMPADVRTSPRNGNSDKEQESGLLQELVVKVAMP
jgi:hypothetical protein